MKMKQTPQDIKEAYDRLKVGKKGLRLKLIKQIAATLYQSCQNAKLN